VSGAPAALADLRARAAELADLRSIASLLFWDQNTMMPPRGAAARADHSSTLELISHGKLTDPAVGRLLDALEPWAADQDPDSDEVRLLAAVRRDHEKAVRVPAELAALIRYTAPFDLSGHPTLTVPAGCTAKGLPVAAQFVGRHLGEADITRIGRAFQRVTDWHRRHPAL